MRIENGRTWWMGLMVAAALAVPARTPRAQDPKVVEITARRFAFAPAEITLKAGEAVVLRVRSEDVTHGFFQRALGLDATLEPGKSVDLPLTPAKPGRYAVICDHYCGSGHGGMKMTIVVE